MHLIDDQTRTWNEGIIKATSLPFEAEIILRIPLSHYRQDDTLI